VYTGDAQKDEMRYQLLKDQLAIYDTHGVSWRIWFYRDLGLQAIVYQHPRGDGAARPAAGPRIPDLGPYPNGAKREARLLVRQILISEARRIIGRVHQTENPV
jgi:hypothetical protein